MTAIDILVLHKAGPAALGLAIDALDTANRIAPHRHGITLPAQPIAASRPRDVVVVLGIGAAGPEEIEQRLAEADAREAALWLRAAHRRGSVLAAACTGVFLLGDAGALDGRRCTATW